MPIEEMAALPGKFLISVIVIAGLLLSFAGARFCLRNNQRLNLLFSCSALGLWYACHGSHDLLPWDFVRTMGRWGTIVDLVSALSAFIALLCLLGVLIALVTHGVDRENPKRE